MSDIEVRPATPDDLEALTRITDATGLFPSELLPEMLGAQAGDTTMLVSCVDGTPQGLCYARLETLAEGTWNMLALGVHPDAQRKGLGEGLVAALERDLRKRGQRLVIVDTSGTADFDEARAFYTAQGYEQEARIRDFWAAGDDKITFRKAL